MYFFKSRIINIEKINQALNDHKVTGTLLYVVKELAEKHEISEFLPLRISAKLNFDNRQLPIKVEVRTAIENLQEQVDTEFYFLIFTVNVPSMTDEQFMSQNKSFIDFLSANGIEHGSTKIEFLLNGKSREDFTGGENGEGTKTDSNTLNVGTPEHGDKGEGTDDTILRTDSTEDNNEQSSEGDQQTDSGEESQEPQS